MHYMRLRMSNLLHIITWNYNRRCYAQVAPCESISVGLSNKQYIKTLETNNIYYTGYMNISEDHVHGIKLNI